MSSTVSIAQYAARAEAAEAKITELTSLAAQIQAVAGGASGASASGSGEAGIGEFKNYFLEKLKTLRVAVAEEHEEFVRTQAKNSDLQKEVTKLRYRVEILTRELSAQLGTPVPESIFKDFKEEAEPSKEVKTENSKEHDKKGKDKEKDKGKDKNEKEKDKKGEKDKGDKEKDKGKDKEKDKGKDKKGEKEKGEHKPSEKAERKPSERKQSEKETPAQTEVTQASTEPAVTVHASEGADKGKKAAKGKEQSKKGEGKKEGEVSAESGEPSKKDNKKGGKKDETSAEPKKGGEKPKKDSTRTESEKGEGAPDQAKKGKADAGAKKGDAQKKGGDAAKTAGDKPQEEVKAKTGELDEKAVKACLKEGGKKAQDCVGMSTFGTHFFCVTIESAEGNMKLLEKVMEGMNAEVDPEAEDRKGGAADLGKILFNANDQKLVIMCHTPKEVMDKATAAEWMANVLTATGAKVTSQSENFIQAELDNDPDHGIYALKLRDQGISASFEFLRSKGLMIDDDSDDENYAAAAGINLNAAPGADY